MGVVDDALESLFFGSGSWLSILLFAILFLAIAYRWKYAGFIPFMASAFIGLEYVAENMGYHALTMFSTTILILFVTVTKIRSRKQ